MQALAVAGVLALLAVLVWRLTHQKPAPTAGVVAPAFALRRLDGRGTVSLSSLRGKTVVLNFWASYCEPCKHEAPYLEALSRRDKGRGLVVLGVDTTDVQSDARRFVRAHELTYPIVADLDGTQAASAYGVSDLPVTYVIDRDGRIVGSAVTGPVSPDYTDFQDKLRTALQ
jgi:cytochrome c biogenesis protein CcmG, thiol:disulfide interchange protein DsbE